MTNESERPMSKCSDKAALDQWYPLGTETEIAFGHSTTRLLGNDLTIDRAMDGTVTVKASDRDEPLPIIKRFGLVWATLGEPRGGLFALPEADEEDRRVVNCGAVMVRASGLRIIENFLDMAHFPFVHTDILGAEPHTEVMHYNAEIRRDVDEVWATNCQFFQPQAALSATDGIMTDYIYRVMTPFTTLLYKTRKPAPGAAADGSARRNSDPRRRKLDRLSPLAEGKGHHLRHDDIGCLTAWPSHLRPQFCVKRTAAALKTQGS
jgi:phenylpropionate dioxygenase-like ring-hydroxylating dioxygenase large terminal subunit